MLTLSIYELRAYLWEESQMTFSEIGERLSIPEATAKTYFQRAKPLLRACLGEGEQYQSKWR
jgi:DNA-directed RNA polymerase specialized sigma24 family protein